MKYSKLLFILLDIILSLLSLYICVLFFPPEWQTRYFIIGFLGGLIFVIIASYQNLYRPIDVHNLYQIAVQLIQNWLIIGFLIIVVAFLIRDTENLARHILLTWMFVSPAILLIYRIILKKIILKNKTNILVIGNKYIFTDYEQEALKKQNIALIYCDATNLKTIEDTINNHKINTIVANVENPSPELIKYYTNQSLRGMSFYTLEHFMEQFLRKYYIPVNINDTNSLQYLDNIRPYSASQQLIKIIVDYLGVIILLLPSLFLMPFIAYKISKESFGNIFFTQKRVGLKNKIFVLIKFRSMYLDAEKNGAQFSHKNDPRIFRFGKTMRKTRIDELPQIINVFKRDLHLIGPRAERKIFTQELEKDIPYYAERHIVRPGITGWAQVNYPYGAGVEDARQKLMYDLYYIKKWKLALELEIIVKTIKIVITKQGT